MRTSWILALVVGAALGAGLTWLVADSPPAHAADVNDRKKPSLHEPYTPSFAVWVTRYIRQHYTFTTAIGTVQLASPEIDRQGKLSWTFTGKVYSGSGEPQWKRWLRAKRDLKRDVELWRKQGYDIRYEDFVDEVEAPRRGPFDDDEELTLRQRMPRRVYSASSLRRL